jgi:flagellar biosynthesis repressor protein FlbT
MPLLIEFKSGDKIIINGAVLENAGPNSKLLIHNESTILREKEILSVAETSTPASRVYFALQCAYIFPNKKDEYLSLFYKFLGEFVEASPSASPIAKKILAEVEKGLLYKALKATQGLLNHESKVLDQLNKDVVGTVNADAGEEIARQLARDAEEADDDGT